MTGTHTEGDRHVEALTALATLPGWLEAAMTPRRVEAALRRDVPELADGRIALHSCTPERLRAKGTDWVSRYRLRVTEPGGRSREVVLVGNLWSPDASRPKGRSRPDGTAPFGTLGWRCSLEDPRLDLETEEVDPALPALPALVDRAQARALLEEVLRAAGYRATVTACEPHVVRYKPGSRCTIVYRVRYGADGDPSNLPDPVVVKTYQGDKGLAAWDAMRALWETPLRHGDLVTLAEPLGYLGESRVLVQGPVPEDRTLKELAVSAIGAGDGAALDELRSELAKAARGLAALHHSAARYGRVARFDDELADVDELVARLSLSVPSVAPATRPVRAHLADTALRVPPDPVVSAHHDFRPAQVLLHRGRLGFIDFDGSCMAEPALDVARFRAKLRDIGISVVAADHGVSSRPRLQEHLTLMDELCEHFLDSYHRYAAVSPQRVLLWETCDVLTVLLHAWSKVRLARIEPRLAVLMHQLRANPLV
ncbi:MAG: phosphotransferase [Actinomycetes bacterium]